MFKFFAGIAQFITTAVNFIIDFFISLITIITRTVQAIAYLFVVVGELPLYLKTYLLAMLGVSVLLFFLNKGSD